MDEILRVPRDDGAECGLIGSILIEPSCFSDISAQLSGEDFYFQVNRDIYDTVQAMHDSVAAIDPVTILAEMKTRGVYKEPDSRDYFHRLMVDTPTAAHALQYAAIVRNQAVLRAAQSAAQEAARLAGEQDYPAMQEALQRALSASDEQRAVEIVPFPDALRALYHTLYERRESGQARTGLPTGYDRLDELTGGLHPGNMIVLAGRSGMGKSAMALNIAAEYARISKKTVLLISLEMTALELTERICANYARIGLHHLRDARLDLEQHQRLGKTAAELTVLDLRIVEAPALDMAEITRLCRRVKPALLVIDHLGLVKPSGRHRDRREAVDALSRSMKTLAKNLNIPVMVLAQLNRAILGRRDKSPMLSDLRESGAIEQDADVVLFVDRPAYYDPRKSEDEAGLIVAKNRHGKTGRIPLLWHGQFQRFAPDWTSDAEDAEEEP